MTISEMYRRVTNAINGLDNEIYNIVVELEPNMVEMQRERLFEGKLSTQEKIVPDYAESTKKRKTRKQQPTDRVTLFDTGTMHDNIYIVNEIGRDFILKERIGIFSDTDYVKFLIDKYGEHIFGLTTENKTTLKKQTHQKIVNYVKSKIEE